MTITFAKSGGISSSLFHSNGQLRCTGRLLSSSVAGFTHRYHRHTAPLMRRFVPITTTRISSSSILTQSSLQSQSQSQSQAWANSRFGFTLQCSTNADIPPPSSSSTAFTRQDELPSQSQPSQSQSHQSQPQSSQQPLPPTHQIKGIIFDMDGTLTKHCIDFASMRQQIYAIADADTNNNQKERNCVLETYKTLSPSSKLLADQVFTNIESKAIQDMELLDKDELVQLLTFLDSNGISRAILTRNVSRSVDAFHRLLWEETGLVEFFPAVARDTLDSTGNGDDGNNDDNSNPKTIPPKPEPDAIQYICNLWNCHPNQVVMVGDSAADDIVAAYRAGCGGRVLLQHGGISLDTDSGGGGGTLQGEEKEVVVKERIPTLVVQSHGELLERLLDG